MSVNNTLYFLLDISNLFYRVYYAKKGYEETKYICKAVLFVSILKLQNTFLILEKRLCLNVLVIPLAYNLYKRFEMSLR